MEHTRHAITLHTATAELIRERYPITSAYGDGNLHALLEGLHCLTDTQVLQLQSPAAILAQLEQAQRHYLTKLLHQLGEGQGEHQS